MQVMVFIKVSCIENQDHVKKEYGVDHPISDFPPLVINRDEGNSVWDNNANENEYEA